MDYEAEFKKSTEKRRKQYEEERQRKNKEHTNRFFKSFFGWDLPNEEISFSEDYPYNVFGLKKSASNEDMKREYRKAVLKAHPDRGGTNEAFRKIREAWEYFKSNIF